MSALPLDDIEAQAILLDRVARYAKERRIGSLAEAVERLTRIGLFTECAPEGATLVKTDALPAWRPPSAAEPCRRGEPDDGDIPF